MQQLFDSDCELRVLKPAGGGFSAMHAKTMIFDQELVLTGSANLTHNAMENNKEHLLRITDSDVVKEMLKDFELEWAKGIEVDQAYLDVVHKNAAAKKLAKGKSRGRGPSRSLSREMDEAASSSQNEG
jgi:phosphatidylserine/phosphatidylglycerophosphate/cardiolipin synthase-like enzyme